MARTIAVWGLLAIGCSPALRPSAAETAVVRIVEMSAPADEEPDPIAVVDAVLMQLAIEDNRGDRDLALALDRAGLTEPMAIAAMAACLASATRPLQSCATVMPKTYEQLSTWLGQRGTVRALPVLYAHDERGVFEAGRAVEAILERRMTADAGPCVPPAADEVAIMREQLGDFAVIDRSARDTLVARAPRGDELDDLAYFMVAMRHAGAPVASEAHERHSGIEPLAADLARRTAWLEEIEQARKIGDLTTVQQRGVAYLESLGFPGDLDLSAEANMTWGGAMASRLMREVAITSEILGEVEIAAALYHRANPGGGSCGTSVGYRWQKQVEGFIRTRERVGGCAEVVAERLLDIAGDFDDASPYGTARLKEAGFDIPRLYRGALVTRNRDVDAARLDQAIARAPAELGKRARQRLAARGPEAWEARVHAIEGIADEIARPGVEQLAQVLGVLAPSTRARAIKSIGIAAARTSVGVCEGEWISLGGFSIGGAWQRPVHAFGTTCATQLTDDEAEAMTARLRPWLADRDPVVRAAALEATGKIAAPRSRTRLAREHGRARAALARCVAGGPDAECNEESLVADAAAEALQAIERINLPE